MGALAAIQQEGTDLALYYERKTKVEGKGGLVALNAVKNKLLNRIYACNKELRLYEVAESFRSRAVA